jgi:ABC-type branched-subunit amino acid transport system ATPase component
MFRAEGISVSYGGVRAVDMVTLTVNENEVVGLVGANGSGKSSLLNALTGITSCTGTVTFDGKPLNLKSAVRVHRNGVARVFQAPQIYAALSVLDNVMLTTVPHRRDSIVLPLIVPPVVWRDEARRQAAAHAALSTVGLGSVARQPAGGLSYGQRRLLELGRALASLPKLLLLDEPSAGLNDAETDELRLILSRARERGIAIVVVDHKVDFLDALCDRIVFMEQGRVVAEGTPDVLWSDQRVIDAYLGSRRTLGADDRQHASPPIEGSPR